MGTNPALGGNQLAAAQGHGFAQGLAAFRSEAGRVGRQRARLQLSGGSAPDVSTPGRAPSARCQWSRLSQCLSWDHAEGHMHSLFRPQWEALPLCWPGSCH